MKMTNNQIQSAKLKNWGKNSEFFFGIGRTLLENKKIKMFYDVNS